MNLKKIVNNLILYVGVAGVFLGIIILGSLDTATLFVVTLCVSIALWVLFIFLELNAYGKEKDINSSLKDNNSDFTPDDKTTEKE